MTTARKAKGKWDTFCDDVKLLKEGEEVAITIRNLVQGPRKYESRYVKAVVSSAPEKGVGWDELWVRWQRGYLRPEPWAIKIVEELGEIMPRGAPMEGRGSTI